MYTKFQAWGFSRDEEMPPEKANRQAKTETKRRAEEERKEGALQPQIYEWRRERE